MGLSSIFVRNSASFLYVIAKWSDDSVHDKGRRAFALRPNQLFRLFRDRIHFLSPMSADFSIRLRQIQQKPKFTLTQ